MGIITLNTNQAIQATTVGLSFADDTINKTIVDKNYIVNLKATIVANSSIILYVFEKRINGGSWNILNNSITNIFNDVVITSSIYEYRVKGILADNSETVFSNIIILNYTNQVNIKPIAKIASAIFPTGTDVNLEITINTNQIFILDGSFSEDTDGTIIAYNWEVIEEVQNSSYQLLNANTAIANFITSDFGSYVLKLIVTDNNLETDEILITLNVLNISNASFTNFVITANNNCETTFEGAYIIPEGTTGQVTGELLQGFEGSFASFPSGISNNILSGKYPYKIILGNSGIALTPSTYIIAINLSNGKTKSLTLQRTPSNSPNWDSAPC